MSQIAVWRGKKNGFVGYWHHGVLCPDGSVIHFTAGDPKLSRQRPRKDRIPRIARTPFEHFTWGAEEVYDVHPKKHAKLLPVDQAVERAESRLGEQGYSLLFKNCENFASWCVTGENKSRQIGTHVMFVVAGFLPYGITGAAAGIVMSARKMAFGDRKRERLTLRTELPTPSQSQDHPAPSDASPTENPQFSLGQQQPDSFPVEEGTDDLIIPDQAHVD